MSELESRKRFEPAEVEPRVMQRWLDSGLFHPEAEGSAAENYSIAVPPPNVTGALHMGHALHGSVQDALMRYHRMLGRRAKWIFGTDHAGIATQRQVEKLLQAEGTGREELGREAFVERVWRWREQYGGQINEQFRRLGAGLDYSDERFTLDDNYVRAVLKVFVDLFQQGLIYRDHYMVNWDPVLGTAVSDLEVEDREETDTLYDIAYDLEGGGGEVVVATVRPETMLADTAVSVHPDDERYRHLVGRTAILPLVGRTLPIIADDYVKPEFGTGCLKITPGHDPNDFEIGRRHKLPQITVIGQDGLMSEQAGEFAGLEVLEARERVVAALGDRVRSAKPYTHEVPYSQRSGARVEPLISLQWFMHMAEPAPPAIDALRQGRAHGDDGPALPRRRAVQGRLRPLHHPGARRPADVQVAGDGHRPARPARPLRRGRDALRAAGHVELPGRTLQRGEDRPGRAAGHEAVERLALRPARRGRGRRGGRR